MTRPVRLLWWLLIGLSLSPLALGKPLHCALTPSAVEGAANDDEAALACQGAAEAFAFFSALGVALPERVSIELVAALPAGVPADAIGAYARGAQRASVLHYAILQPKHWLGVPMDRELYRAVIAHEVAHAIMRNQPGLQPLPVVAYEYLAYVTTFAALPAATRDQVLAALPGTGFDNEHQINVLSYMFDPAGFGAEAWRHWQRLADARGFARRVLEGRAIRDIEID